MKIDNRKDFLLLLLYSDGVSKALNEPVVGRTRLTKMLFLFKQEILAKFRRGDEADIPFYEFFRRSDGDFSGIGRRVGVRFRAW